MRQPRAHKPRKKATGATNITARIPDGIVDTALSDLDVGCVSCSLVFDDIYTVNLCGDHFWCINCAIDQFTAATQDIELFPVNCCGKNHVLALQAVQYLLPSRVVQLYSTKLAESTTERKVWCSNEDCGEFLPKRWYRKLVQNAGDWDGILLHIGTVGHCKKCGDETCLHCGQIYADSTHVCKLTTEMMIELPPYAQECRFKQCPGCKTPVELRDACNHMICVCGFQYCFVCLLKWSGYHDCPEYGDPPYDANGRDDRGLHVRTGLDEGGYDRLGEHKYYPPRRATISSPIVLLDLVQEIIREHHANQNNTDRPDEDENRLGLGIDDNLVAEDFQDPAAWDSDDLPALVDGSFVGEDPHIPANWGRLPPLHDREWITTPSRYEEDLKDESNANDKELDVENAMVTMFGDYEKRFDRLNPVPSITDTFNIGELAILEEETKSYQDRSLVTLALRRPGRETLSYESIDLGHMTWFGILAMSAGELERLNSGDDRSWKAVHSRKYAYDTVYGFEAQSVDMYLEKLVKEHSAWEERKADRFLDESVVMRDLWVFRGEVEDREVNYGGNW